ncbi:MAG: type II toxin-antitoxin system RelE/ParE family toxin [Acidobacteria bacterium]|nr:MAG: type II toxin-antitoxin system RelE/ParE family toxin [Acidobacteriota bacterium]REK02117.1 MAG: type II toxin-antitoxin system RelE/ParE family toxin [Acidobacteriota bacterium]REK14081.1 MAG: type II toxin-antitoxin system RelE/ParE family toxin [Acidobacteriota bacterium]REK42076.1 MAG: type II toxin-antitoxin system RelE/ParE family toxin [Acidobacteriota bacterium]
MAEVIWTEPALEELNAIAEYIAIDNEGAARKLVGNVFRSVSRLETHPESGRVPPELLESRYREVIIGPCRVFYRLDGSSVFIVFVLRSERDLRNYLIDRLDL